MSAAPAVQVRELTKRFGAFTAVDRLTLDVAPGEVFGLLGSNGAGKSTVIRMLCGLLRPTSGVAHVLGIDVARRPEEVKRALGYMTQRFSLYEDLTVVQNLRFYGGVYGLHGEQLRERQAWAVGTAGLSGMEDRLTRSLPGGFKQRLALACSVLHRPRILLLDEPTGGVDPISRRRFWDRIDELARDGTTILVTTHYLDEAEHCGRIALLHAARLVALGSVRTLKSVFAGRRILEVSCPRPLDGLRALESLPWVHECSVFGAHLHVVVDEDADGERRIREHLESAGNPPSAVARIVPTLEDVFIHSIEAEEARVAGARSPR